MSEHSEIEFYSTKALANLLDIKTDWLNHNRNTANPIPFKEFGRFIRYQKSDVLAWIGTSNLELKFFSTSTLAKKLNVSVDWVKYNRRSNNPIPFHKLGYLIRYQQSAVLDWIEKNNKSSTPLATQRIA